MWDWINCHLARRHEFVVWTDTNAMFLRCLRCGRRSSGWQVAPPADGAHRHASPPRGGTRNRHGLIAGARALLGLAHAER